MGSIIMLFSNDDGVAILPLTVTSATITPALNASASQEQSPLDSLAPKQPNVSCPPKMSILESLMQESIPSNSFQSPSNRKRPQATGRSLESLMRASNPPNSFLTPEMAVRKRPQRHRLTGPHPRLDLVNIGERTPPLHHRRLRAYSPKDVLSMTDMEELANMAKLFQTPKDNVAEEMWRLQMEDLISQRMVAMKNK